ncbi:hypothetical protein PCE1_003858 [Barthelona sp. PCE]
MNLPHILEDERDWLSEFSRMQKMGSGSFGTVYSALHKVSGETVALKEINVSSFSETVMQTFREEVRMLHQLNHNNVVGYFGSFFNVKKDKLYIVTEYADAGSLDDLLKIYSFSPSDERVIAFIARELLSGITHLHENKLMHRDIKGGNVLLSRNGDVKICDFGVSKMMEATVDQAHTFVGSMLWMAPEQIGARISDHKEYGFAVDIWAFGITLIELADGVPPHANLKTWAVMNAITNGDPPTVKTQGYSPLFIDFLSKCLVVDPQQRWKPRQLLSHPFLSNACPKQVILDLLNLNMSTVSTHSTFLQPNLETVVVNDSPRVEEKNAPAPFSSQFISSETVVMNSDTVVMGNTETVVMGNTETVVMGKGQAAYNNDTFQFTNAESTVQLANPAFVVSPNMIRKLSPTPSRFRKYDHVSHDQLRETYVRLMQEEEELKERLKQLEEERLYIAGKI